MMMFRIDAHHHLLNFSEQEYGWISDQMTPLRRSFTPDDLLVELKAAGISGSVAIQARQTLEETRFLLSAAAQHPFIQGVVGWVPLIDLDVEMDLERFSANRHFRGVRHVLQDESDENYILRDDFNRGVRALRQFDLSYDILIFERHLPQTIRFVDQHPDQRFIVDHLAKPRVRYNAISPWKEHLFELAKRPNVYCKISGLATEANHAKWTREQLEPYIHTVLEAFKPNRVMFGSDWPVCLLAIPYQKWVALLTEETAKLSPTEQQNFWGLTATEAYKLLQVG
jgi:L-fuconolactonase